MRVRATPTLLAVAGLLVVLFAAFGGFTAGRQLPRGSGPAVSSGSVTAAGAADSGEAVAGPAVAAVPAAAAAPAPAATGTSGPGDPGAVPVGAVGRQLVRTAQLALEVEDPTAAGRRIRTAAVAAGGTVAEEDSTESGSHLTVRVPVDRLDPTMDALAALGHVTSRQSQTVDATEDVIDLDARVASQRASVDRVRALLSKATSIGDVVAVESELTRREADLDSLTGRLDALRGQVALSTLTVDVERGTAAPAPTAPAGFLSGLASGRDGLRAVAAGAGVAVGYVLPFLPVLAVLVGLVWVGRRLVRGRQARRSAPEASGTI